MRRLRLAPLLVALAVALPACSGGSSGGEAGAGDTLTRSQKDSAIAESPLPGAQGVGGAMEARDAARERAARLDSLDGS